MEYSIDLVHTHADEHIVTAFSPDGEAILSIARDGYIVDGIKGERIEQLDTWDDDGDTWTLRASVEACARHIRHE